MNMRAINAVDDEAGHKLSHAAIVGAPAACAAFPAGRARRSRAQHDILRCLHEPSAD